MNDNIENLDNSEPSVTTITADSSESPDDALSVSNVFSEGAYFGGDTSEVVQVLEEVKTLQTETNNILTNISVICLLFVSLFGILIAQGFVQIFKKR